MNTTPLAPHIFTPPVSWAGFILHVLAHELDRVCSQAERDVWVERVRAGKGKGKK